MISFFQMSAFKELESVLCPDTAGCVLDFLSPQEQYALADAPEVRCQTGFV